MINTKVPSLKLRYAYKLFTNFTSLPLYFLLEALLPRALGPQLYGNFHFVTTVFNQLIIFLDMGTSTCFSISLARRPKNYSLVAFYSYLSFAIFMLTFISSLIIMLPPIGNVLMPNVPLWLAPLGALWAFLSWWNITLLGVNDAIGLTIKSEIIRSIFYMISILVLTCMFFTNTLNIKSLFVQQFIVISLLSATYYWLMRNYWVDFSFRLTARQIKTFFGYFYNYSHPLFVQTLFLFIFLTLERWLLQNFSGSAEHGYFTLAHKVAVACMIFIMALIPLLARELSIAWSKRNVQLIRQLIEKYLPTLYFIVAYFSCFVASESKVIALLFGGAEFSPAAVPIQFMALYPVFLAHSYITNIFYMATGRTRYVRNITILECLLGFVLAWFLLAPEIYFGLQLGAAGLTLKFLIMQLFISNFSFWFAARLLHINFWKTLCHQIITIGILLSLAFICHNITLAYLQINMYMRFLIAGFSYSCLALLLLISLPKLAGLNRERLDEYFKLLFIKLRLKKVD